MTKSEAPAGSSAIATGALHDGAGTAKAYVALVLTSLIWGSTPVAIETPKKKPIVRARFLVLSVIVIGVVGAGFVLTRVLPQIAARRGTGEGTAQEPASESPFTLPEPTVTAYDATADAEIVLVETAPLH